MRTILLGSENVNFTERELLLIADGLGAEIRRLKDLYRRRLEESKPVEYIISDLRCAKNLQARIYNYLYREDID